MPSGGPLLLRFLAKLVCDVLPAVLASVIGGIVFTHYQLGFAGAPKPAAEQVAPASAEMVQLLRDEHAAMVDFLKAQMAAEKNRLAAEDEASARSVAEAATATVAGAAALRVAASRAVMTAAKPTASRGRAPALATSPAPPRAPALVAQVQPSSAAAPVAPPARSPDTLLAKTLDIKDHVVDATLHVIGKIGSLPSLIASIGDRVGGSNANSPPVERLVGAPS